ncbi:LuxR C-terminal-related transcriptional regulator [Streptomyces formicae]
MALTPRQAAVLAAVADGKTLTQAAAQLGIRREQVASRLSDAYKRLDIAWMPRPDRREAAIRIARKRGLIPDPDKEHA